MLQESTSAMTSRELVLVRLSLDAPFAVLSEHVPSQTTHKTAARLDAWTRRRQSDTHGELDLRVGTRV